MCSVDLIWTPSVARHTKDGIQFLARYWQATLSQSTFFHEKQSLPNLPEGKLREMKSGDRGGEWRFFTSYPKIRKLLSRKVRKRQEKRSGGG
jgi:hypothetical protein